MPVIDRWGHAERDAVGGPTTTTPRIAPVDSAPGRTTGRNQISNRSGRIPGRRTWMLASPATRTWGLEWRRADERG